MFHRLAGIAVTEQFVQVCAVRRWRLFDGSFALPQRAAAIGARMPLQGLCGLAGGARVACKNHRAEVKLASTEALAKLYEGPQA